MTCAYGPHETGQQEKSEERGKDAFDPWWIGKNCEPPDMQASPVGALPAHIFDSYLSTLLRNHPWLAQDKELLLALRATFTQAAETELHQVERVHDRDEQES